LAVTELWVSNKLYTSWVLQCSCNTRSRVCNLQNCYL